MQQASITIKVDPKSVRRIRDVAKQVMETQQRLFNESLNLCIFPIAGVGLVHPTLVAGALEAARKEHKRVLIEGLGAKMCPNCESALPVDQSMCGCGCVFE